MNLTHCLRCKKSTAVGDAGVCTSCEKFRVGVKQCDLQPCILCGKGICHSNQIACTRIRVSRMLVNIRAVEQQHGLELMLGGAAPLAMAMGPDRDMLVPVHDEETVLVCDRCSIDQMRLCELHELIEKRTRDHEEADAKAAAESVADPHSPTQSEVSAARAGGGS